MSIDLMGFDLAGTAGSASGIVSTPGARNIVVQNGTLRNWGNPAINAVGATNSRFVDLHLTDNSGDALVVGDNCVVQRCVAQSNAELRHCP